MQSWIRSLLLLRSGGVVIILLMLELFLLQGQYRATLDFGSVVGRTIGRLRNQSSRSQLLKAEGRTVAEATVCRG